MSKFPKPKDAQDAVYVERDFTQEEFEELMRAKKAKAEKAKVRPPPPKAERHRKARVWNQEERARQQRAALEGSRQQRQPEQPALAAQQPPARGAVPAPSVPASRPNKDTGGFSLGSCLTGGCLSILLLVGGVVGLAWWNNRPEPVDPVAPDGWNGFYYPSGSISGREVPCRGTHSSFEGCASACQGSIYQSCSGTAGGCAEVVPFECGRACRVEGLLQVCAETAGGQVDLSEGWR